MGTTTLLDGGTGSNVLQYRRITIVYNNKHFKIIRSEEFEGSQHRIDNFEELERVITLTCSLYIIHMYPIIILCPVIPSNIICRLEIFFKKNHIHTVDHVHTVDLYSQNPCPAGTCRHDLNQKKVFADVIKLRQSHAGLE